jgi:hypothetical protein
VVNRAYFAASLTDRGDEFCEQFAEGFGELLAEQDSGRAETLAGVSESWGDGPDNAHEPGDCWGHVVSTHSLLERG